METLYIQNRYAALFISLPRTKGALPPCRHPGHFAFLMKHHGSREILVGHELQTGGKVVLTRCYEFGLGASRVLDRLSRRARRDRSLHSAALNSSPWRPAAPGPHLHPETAPGKGPRIAFSPAVIDPDASSRAQAADDGPMRTRAEGPCSLTVLEHS